MMATHQDSFLRGMLDILPLTIGAVPFALMVGTLAGQAGLGHVEMLMMSAFVFAGASQFTALEMWATPVPVMAIILTTAMVNLRHVMMGAALAPHIINLPAFPRTLFTLIFADETWAIAIRRTAERPLTSSYVLGLIGPFYVNWLLFSGLGVTFGHLVTDPEKYGFDFVFTAVFITIIIGFWKGARSAPPLLASVVTSLLVHATIPGVWYIFLGGLAGVITGALLYKEERK